MSTATPACTPHDRLIYCRWKLSIYRIWSLVAGLSFRVGADARPAGTGRGGGRAPDRADPGEGRPVGRPAASSGDPPQPRVRRCRGTTPGFAPQHHLRLQGAFIGHLTE